MATGPTPWPKKGGWHWVFRVQTPEGRESPRDHGQPWVRFSSRPHGSRQCNGYGALSSGLQALKQVAKEVGLDLRGASLNLDGSFDFAHNRQMIFNAGLIPNIKENPRNRKITKRGRKRFFNEVIHTLRMRVERTCAWETNASGGYYALNASNNATTG
jgi:hypothetical protein